MATRQREPISPRWPTVATSASLPNVAGSPTQSSYLQVGDECYVSGDGELYVCVVATLGAAAWRAQAGIADGEVTEAKLSSALQTTIAALIDTADPLSVFTSYQTINVTSRYTDFLTSSTGNYPYSGFGIGTGNAQNWFSAQDGRAGLVTLETGTDTTGQYYVGTNQSAVSLGFGTCRWRSDLYIHTLSDATDDFTTRIGFIDATGAECVDGCYFRQNHAVNGGRWQFVTRSNNVETGSATDTGVSPSTTTLQTFEIEVNATGTQAVARINGAVVATNTANIPTGAARATGIGLQIKKAAGTNNRRLVVDLMGDRLERTTAI